MSCDHELANEWVRCSGKNASYITIIVILGCEKHVQPLLCVYLAVLCDIMLCALLSSIVNRILFEFVWLLEGLALTHL